MGQRRPAIEGLQPSAFPMALTEEARRADAWKTTLHCSNIAKRLQRSREADHKKQVRELARERLSWFDALDAQKVLGEMVHVLEDHFGNPQHMKQSRHSLDPKETMFCAHDSEIVSLDGSRRTDYESDLLLLRPSHGFGLVEEGWEFISFPTYEVLVPSQVVSSNTGRMQ